MLTGFAVLTGFAMLAGFAMLLMAFAARAPAAPLTEPPDRTADIGHGIRLHYLEQGSSTAPVLIFVHGSLSDYTYWQQQLAPFAARYHVIAYSRRYNFPNQNPARPGYSAITDAEDLAALIGTLHLGKVFIVGHSYGALTALFLAVRRPDLVHAAVLAEPPAVSLLQYLPAAQTAQGQAVFTQIQRGMIAPMRAAFAAGNTSQGVAAFIDYVFADSHAWEEMPPSAKSETLRDAHEWDVMMTTGTLFPELPPEAVRTVRVPLLLMSGAKSYPFLAMIDEELLRLLPDVQRIVYADAGHQMWLKAPTECRDAAAIFFAEHGGPAL